MSAAEMRNAMLGNIEERVESYKSAIASLDGRYQSLNNIASEAMRTGVLRFTLTDEHQFDEFGLSVRGYFKAFFRELDRPYIIAQDGVKYALNTMHVQFPSTKRMENLVSPLLLVTEEMPPVKVGRPWNWHNYSHENQGKAIRVDQGGWHFYFVGDARATFESIVQSWLENPVYRVVMKLSK